MRDRREVRALEERLFRAWSSDEGPALDARWREGVLDAVRAEAERARIDDDRRVDRLVRRALLVAAAAAVLAIVVFGPRAAALEPSFELARVVASDPASLLQLVLVLG